MSPIPYLYLICFLMVTMLLIGFYLSQPTLTNKIGAIGCSVAYWAIPIVMNLRHRNLYFFCDHENPYFVHHHPRIDRFGQEFRDHTDRKIEGPILVLPVSGLLNRARVLNVKGSQRVAPTKSKYSNYGSSFDYATVVLTSAIFKVEAPVLYIFELICENLMLTDHLHNSRRVLEEKTARAAAQEELYMAERFLRIFGAFLEGLRERFAKFPNASKAAQLGREEIDAFVGRFPGGKVGDWTIAANRQSIEEQQPEAEVTAV